MLSSLRLLTFLAVSCLSWARVIDISENSEEVTFVGRFDFSTLYPRATWPGSTFILSLAANFSNNFSVNVTFDIIDVSTKYFIRLFIDDVFYNTYEISSASSFIHLDIPSETEDFRDFRFVKVTESSYGEAMGVMAISEIIVSDAILSTATTKSAKFLFVGDSLTAAYGVDGEAPCVFSASTENVLDGYAGLTSQYLDAEMHVIAWSGKGVVRNYGDPNQLSSEPLPLFYNRTIATDANSYWDPSQYTPDVVYVMLSHNDYSTDPQPTDDQFTNGLIDLLVQIQTDYPETKIVVACAPLPYHNGNQCVNIEQAAVTVSATYLYVPDTTSSGGGYGCDNHPGASFQSNIADVVIKTFVNILT